MGQRGPVWEAEFAEFAAARAAGLRRQAFARCGDWALADQALEQVLGALYRRWPTLGNEAPEDFVDRWLRRELRRARPARAVRDDELAPATAVELGALIVRARRRRARARLAGAALTAVTLAAAVGGLALLRPEGGGGRPLPELMDCMSEVPMSALPRSAKPIATSGSPVPVDVVTAARAPSGGTGGVDRLATVADLAPLPGVPGMASQLTWGQAEQLACAFADLLMRLVNPLAVERIELGLRSSDTRPLWPAVDPGYGTALTASVLIMTPSGISTATLTVAQTAVVPLLSHCSRLAFCLTSSKGERGEIIEEYLAYSTTTGSAGFTLGEEASWQAMLIFTGHTLISLTVTNTPDVRAALPATQLASPLSPQLASVAGDRRLALFDPPATTAAVSG